MPWWPKDSLPFHCLPSLLDLEPRAVGKAFGQDGRSDIGIDRRGADGILKGADEDRLVDEAVLRSAQTAMGQRLMQSASEGFLGWLDGQDGRQLYARQLRDAKIRLLIETFDAEMLEVYC